MNLHGLKKLIPGIAQRTLNMRLADSTRDVVTEALYPEGFSIQSIAGEQKNINTFCSHVCRNIPLQDFLQRLGVPNHSSIAIKHERVGFLNLEISTPLKIGRSKITIFTNLEFCIIPEFRDVGDVFLQKMHITNHRNRIVSGRGLGSRIFCSIAEGLKDLGFTKISCYAYRNRTNNGYYTWPRLGFDTELPIAYQGLFTQNRILTASGKPVTTLLDMMETPKGRTSWRRNGDTRQMHFYLRSDSRSWRVLNAYKRERGISSMQDIRDNSVKGTIS